MKAPCVSIIIPVFNKWELTIQCLKALTKLSAQVPYEVIVVDNASMDGTPQHLKEFAGRIRLLRRATNGGFAIACNEGAAAATSGLLLFLNNDTIPLAGWLEPLLKELQDHPEVAAVGSKLLFPTGLIQHAGVAFARETRSPFHPHLLLRADDPRVNHRRELQAITGACLLVRGTWFGRCGGFNEQYVNGYEDLELCLQIRRQGGVLVYQPKSVLYHLESQTPGRKQHDNQNRQLFFQRWSELLLSDEDAYFFADSYRLLERRGDWPPDCRLARLESETDRQQWGMVAQTQLAAAAGQWPEVIQSLSNTEGWPEDARVRRWAGAVSRRFRIDAAAQRHLQKALELEEDPEVRLHLNLSATMEPAEGKNGASQWGSRLWGARAKLRGLDFDGARDAFETALAEGAPASWTLPGWADAARQLGLLEEAGALEAALRSLPHVDPITEDQLQPKPVSGSAAVPQPVAPPGSLVSIIILAHNQIDHTRKCVASLAVFTKEPHEIIVVDNGSSDGTREFLERWQAGLPNHLVVRNQKNLGFAAGNNQGLAIARGGFLVLLNNDTIVTEGWLAGLLEVFTQHPRTGVLGPMSNFVSGPQLVPDAPYANLSEMPPFAARFAREHRGQSVEVERAVGFCLAIRRRVIDAVGGLDECFGSGNFEDDDFCMRARLAGFGVRIAQGVFIHHTGSQTFKGARIDYQAAMQHNWTLFKSKWRMPAADPLEKGYRAPTALPAGVSIRVPLPQLQLTHTLSPDGRSWRQTKQTRSEPAVAAGSKQARAINLPDCALVGHLAEARTQLGNKKHRAAWESTVGAIRARPYHPEAYLLLAQIALAAGDSASARRCAQHARLLAPDWKPARRFLKSHLRGNAKPEWLLLPETLARCPAPCAPRLSVCLIVKDEEKFLGQCLASVRGLADQIVVVDTGSTDRTVAIAKEHGAEIYDFAWRDDFSAARNAALEHAKGDWVLMLDADEELPSTSHDALRKLLAVPSVMAWRLPIIDVGRENEGCCYVPRLFRNAPVLFYIGRVHEQVFASIEVRREEWGLDNRLGDAPLRHHGYLPEVVKDRNKIQRNLRLLEKAVVELPDEPNLLMNYGLELARSGQLETGLEQYRRAFDLMSAQASALVIPETREMLLTQLCTHLSALRRFDEIIRLLTSPLAQSGGLTASLHFALGLAHLELKQPREAADQMRQCLAKRGQQSLAPINPEIHLAGPHHCLALCLAQLGDTDAAAAEARLAIQDDPQSRPARFDYARLLAARGQSVEALNLLFELAKQKADDSAVWVLGGQIALGRQEFIEVALDWTAEASGHFPQDLAILRQRAEALTLANRCEEALPLWRMLRPESDPALAAVLVLCELVANDDQFSLPANLETQISREFLKWYQRVLQFNGRRTADAINLRFDSLKSRLPTVAHMLEQALAQARVAVAA